MVWLWVCTSIVIGAIWLPSLAIDRRPDGSEFALAKSWRISMLAVIGGGCGWFVLYKAPTVLYRGTVAFVHLYNDPSAPLLKLVPMAIGSVVGISAGQAGIWAWRRGILAQKSERNALSALSLILAVGCWLGALFALFAGTYIAKTM